MRTPRGNRQQPGRKNSIGTTRLRNAAHAGSSRTPRSQVILTKCPQPSANLQPVRLLSPHTRQTARKENEKKQETTSTKQQLKPWHFGHLIHPKRIIFKGKTANLHIFMYLVEHLKEQWSRPLVFRWLLMTDFRVSVCVCVCHPSSKQKDRNKEMTLLSPTPRIDQVYHRVIERGRSSFQSCCSGVFLCRTNAESKDQTFK